MQQSSFDTAHMNIMDMHVVVVFLPARPALELFGVLERSAQGWTRRSGGGRLAG